MLILSARRSVDDRVHGLQAGGDDYLTKPFAFAELLARVQALVRRATRAPEPTTLTVEDVVWICCREGDARGQAARPATARVHAARIPDAHAGHVVSKTMILSHVWEYNFDPQTNVVDVLVSRLREKIDRPFEKKLLHTVRGVGYVLRPRTFGLRLALWYATLFVSGAIAIVFVTYYLTAASLAQRDHQIINVKLGDYAAAYSRGGVRVLAAPSAPSSRQRRNGCSCASSTEGSRRWC